MHCSHGSLVIRGQTSRAPDTELMAITIQEIRPRPLSVTTVSHTIKGAMRVLGLQVCTATLSVMQCWDTGQSQGPPDVMSVTGTQMWRGWLASESHGSSFLYLLNRGLTAVCHHTQHFAWVLGFELKSSCMQRKLFTD